MRSGFSYTQTESGAYLRDSSRVPRRHPFIYLKPPYAIGCLSRVYRVTHLRTDGVHSPPGTGPVVLNVVLVMDGAFFAGGHGTIINNVPLSFPTPTNIGIKWAC